MLDRPDNQLHTSATRLLARLVSDFGREHGRAYAASAVLLALIALSNTGVALLLKPVLNGMATAERFGEMRTMAFEVLGLFVLRGAATSARW